MATPHVAKALERISASFRSQLVQRPVLGSHTSLAYRLHPDDLEALDLQCKGQLEHVLSLDLASQPELNSFNKHQAIKFFARGPNDTGSPEVQAGILTVRLDYLTRHSTHHRHDYKASRLAVQLIHERKRHLKYLRRISLPRFFDLLDKLGLPHNYLETFDQPYLYKYRSSKK